MARNLIGALVADRYRLDRLLGEGGYGAVYAATHLEMGTPLAVKLLHARHAENDDTATRFRREARNTARLRHPHCVTVFDFGRTELDDEAAFFIAMELLVGHTLGQVLASNEPMPCERVLQILTQTLIALEAAHALDLVHRDLKPDNIFLTRIGPVLEHVKVLDFGIAKALESDDSVSVTASGTIIGTPAFMSPEQCRGVAIDARSDLYSLGCVAWNMWVGRPPFKRDNTLGYLLAHVQETPPSLAKSAPYALPPALVAWVERCLAKHPDDRFDSATAAREALEQARASVGTPPNPLTTGLGIALAQPPRARMSRWVGVAALPLIGALAAFVVAGMRGDENAAFERVDANLPVPTEAAHVETTPMEAPPTDVQAGTAIAVESQLTDLAAPKDAVAPLATLEDAVAPSIEETRPELVTQTLDAFCTEAQTLPERTAQTLAGVWQRRAPEVERALGQPLMLTIDERDPRHLAIMLCLTTVPTTCAACEVVPTANSAPRPKAVVTAPVPRRTDVRPTPHPTRPSTIEKPPEFQRLGD